VNEEKEPICRSFWKKKRGEKRFGEGGGSQLPKRDGLIEEKGCLKKEKDTVVDHISVG